MDSMGGFEQVVCPHSEAYPRNSEGDIVSLSDGRLLLGWTCFAGGYMDFSDAHIAAKLSSDGGYTWSEPFVLQPNVGKVNTMSLSFLRAQNDLFMFYLVKEDTAGDCNLYVRKSQDDGKTWNEAVRVTNGTGYYVVNNARVILTSSNRIVVPAAHSNIEHKDPAAGVCFYSDDQGVTWKRSKSEIRLSDSRTGVQEPGLVELSDGSLMMIIRSDKGYIYKSKSLDGGDTWSEAEAMPLVTCISPATIKRIPDTNKLLMIWNPSVFGKNASWRQRWPLCSAVSEDEGETWNHVKYLEASPGICHAYTSITFIGDKTYLTYYEWKDLPHKDNFDGTSVKLRIIDTKWFYE
jgi:sialidase-1